MFTNSTQRSEADTSIGDSQTKELMEPDLRPWENSDPFVSAHTRDIIAMVLDCYVRQVISMLGIPGNVVCCIVFLKQGLLDRINLLLFWLAVADLINVVILFMTDFYCYIETWDKLLARNWVTVITTTCVYMGFWASFVSGALIVLMSVDRCLSVVMPLKAGRLLSYRPMLVAIIVIYLGLLVLHVPNLFIYTLNWTVDPLTKRSIAYMAITKSFDSRILTEIINLTGMILKLVCVIVVVFCCIVTIVQLRKASRQRLQMQELGKKESGGGDTRITHMLLFLCIVYVILHLPQVCSQITTYFVPDFFVYRKYHNIFYVIYDVSFTASCLNSTINFFVYVVLGTKFRITLRELCRCCGNKPSLRIG